MSREVPLLNVGVIRIVVALALLIIAAVVNAAPRSDPEQAYRRRNYRLLFHRQRTEARPPRFWRFEV